MELAGRRVLVTNILSPLGLDIAKTMTAAGALVVGGYHEERAGQAMTMPDVARAIPYVAGDSVSARMLLDAMVTFAGGLDAAIILPYALPRAPFLEQSGDDWDTGLAINAAGMHYVGQAAAVRMVEQGTPGSIVYLSTVASEMPFHEVSLYATTLAAINTIARVAAVELGQHGITVNVVAPGWLQAGEDGPFTFAGAEFPNLNADDIAHITYGIPLGRIGQTDEVADLCAFLISSRARYISGAVIPIDGAFAITKTEGNAPFPGGKIWLPYDSGYDPYTSEM